MSLIDTDWNAEWMRLHEGHESPHDVAHWDKRAADYAASAESSSYAAAFIEHIALRPGESVLDIGSGSGTLALPLARDGHPVCAVDFSKAMLSILWGRAADEDLSGVTTIKASWEDDWDEAGVPVADVAAASRSMAVLDVRAALRKLEGRARRRVCLTVAAGGTLRGLVAQAGVGRERRHRHDYIYAVNVLYQMGILADVHFLREPWQPRFVSAEEGREAIRRLIAPLDEREEETLDRYVAEHLHAAADGGAWQLDQRFVTTWAFLSWDKDEAGDGSHVSRGE